MNAGSLSPLARIAWKDMRRIGGLWTTLVGFWVAVHLLSGAVALRNGGHFAPTGDQSLLLILATAMIYGLSWAGITFAAEHEDKTYGHLRSLPVTTYEVFCGKLLFGVGSTLGLILALGLMSALHAWVLPRIEGSYQWDDIWIDSTGLKDVAVRLTWIVMLIPLGISLGLFWSLRMTSPLQALGLAAISLAIVGLGCASIGGRIDGLVYVSCVAFASISLFMADWQLARRWFPNECQRFRKTRSDATMGKRLSRLWWLHRQQSLWWSVGLIGIHGLLFAAWAAGARQMCYAMFVLAPLTCGWLGVTAFRAEQQENRYRWLAQLNISPWEYWTSRLLAPALAAMIAILVPAISQLRHDPPSVAIHVVLYWILVGCSLAAFCIGQFWSMAMSSIVIAIAATLVTTMVASAWIALCSLLDIPFWLSPGPLLVLPLLSSYLRVSRWFRETGSWKQWVVPSIPLALLILGLPIATAFYRVYEVPAVVIPPEMLAEPPQPTADELVGKAQLNGVLSKLPAGLEPSLLEVWVRDNQSIVDDLLRISQRPFVLSSEVEAVDAASTSSTSVAIDVLLIRASGDMAAGNVDQAWTFYRAALELAWECQGPRAITTGVVLGSEWERRVYRELIPWAMCERTGADRIESAAAFLDDRRQALPTGTDIVRNCWRFYRQRLDAIVANPEKSSDNVVSLAIRLFPWEIARAKRLEDYILVREFHQSQQRDRLLGRLSPKKDRIEIWRRSTFCPTSPPLAAALKPYQDAEQCRRGVIYQLAAMAYHKRHGSYPEALAELGFGGRSLPDDKYEGRMMVLMGVEGDEGVGPRFVSPTAVNAPTGSDAAGQFRHFLLPVFEGWNRQEYEQRVARYSHPNWAIGAAGATRLPRTSDANPGYLFDRLNGELADKVALFAVRRILTEDRHNLRTDLLMLLNHDPELALQFVPELGQHMESANDREGALVASILSKTLRSDAIAVQEKVPDSHRLFSFDAVADQWGVPLRNSENGHFYELVSGGSDLGQVQTIAASRTFRGVSGQVAMLSAPANSRLLHAMAAAQDGDTVTVVIQSPEGGPPQIWQSTAIHSINHVPDDKGMGPGIGGMAGEPSNHTENEQQAWQLVPELAEGSEFSILVEYDPEDTNDANAAPGS